MKPRLEEGMVQGGVLFRPPPKYNTLPEDVSQREKSLEHLQGVVVQWQVTRRARWRSPVRTLPRVLLFTPTNERLKRYRHGGARTHDLRRACQALCH